MLYCRKIEVARNYKHVLLMCVSYGSYLISSRFERSHFKRFLHFAPRAKDTAHTLKSQCGRVGISSSAGRDFGFAPVRCRTVRSIIEHAAECLPPFARRTNEAGSYGRVGRPEYAAARCAHEQVFIVSGRLLASVHRHAATYAGPLVVSADDVITSSSAACCSLCSLSPVC